MSGTERRERVAAIILAAGISSRMGRNKLLLELDGAPVTGPDAPVEEWRFSQEEVKGILTYGRPGTPMQAWGVEGGGALSDQALDNVIAYLWTVQLTPKQMHDEVMGAVKARRAEVHIAGSGDAVVAPTDEIEVHVAGSGRVTLKTRPPKIESHIAGSGRIVQAEEEPKPAPAKPEAAKPAPAKPEPKKTAA